ncbi:fructosamine kinase family protein [Natribacillus halophilus]|uniref:Fructosamine-3-kinase n=1 Tax=Natribacillus halophilus TaxID=549003 RepID=A0A1G8JHY8_9BACI|nr:fructosamine kinase family protein [Natribacillus halophilus]SDI30673.1 Fructosamine-3-kinase [Natribacillus halophilus]
MAVIPPHILRESGLKENTEITPVGGGDINQSCRVHTEYEQFFLKWREDPSPRFFQKEAKQLAILGSVDGVHVPEVVDTGEHFLLLSWVEGRRTAETEEQLGDVIAALHSANGNDFGFDEDNFIGTLPQYNAEKESWRAFYASYRLWPQMEMADQRGRLPEKRKKRAQKLIDNLHKWIPEPSEPALLHGDLWAGNWMVGAHGVPHLIDPAISYGDPAYDRATMSLFGGYSARTMARYHEKVERYDAEETILPVYQLYFLFAHLNMFGEMYGPSVDRILASYQ